MVLLLLIITTTPDIQPRQYWGYKSPEKMEIAGDETHKVKMGKFSAPKVNTIISRNDKSVIKWDLIDTCSFYGRIQSKGRYYVEIDSEKLCPVMPDTLSTLAMQAIEASPEWIRIPLWDNFARMEAACQSAYATLILSTPYPYTDELAFEIARIDPVVLQHYQSDPKIFVDNIKLIYKNDSVLDYVRLVEYSDYTTAKYKIADHNYDTTEIEIPKERYYWDIVHPILQMEAPFYIDPKSGSGVPAYFWRDYLFNYSDTAEKTVWGGYDTDTIYAGYVSPILRDQLACEQILYNNIIDTIPNNGAVGKVSQWIRDIMVFNSFPGDMWNGERSGQPVRIYHLHRGRCGEHSVLTQAAARAALIPTNAPYDVTRDHTWNEWWDTEWRGWEPGGSFLNSTLHYESNNPTWEFRAVFNFRGDGYTWDVTPRYTPYCTLSVTVNDISGLPVDGAKVSVYSEYYDYDVSKEIAESDRKYTDSEGKAEFLLADTVNFYVNVNGISRGIYPAPNKITKIISYAVAGQHYNWSCNLPGHQPSITISQDTFPDTAQLYKIEANFKVNQEIIHGSAMFPINLGSYTPFQKYGYYIDAAKNIEFFICDSANFNAYENGTALEAFEIGHNVDSGNVSFICSDKKRYVVFSTKDLVENGEVVTLDVKLYKNSGAVEDGGEARNFYISVSPTVFRTNLSIKFMLPKTEKISLRLYDLTGRCIKTIINNELKTGYYGIDFSEKTIKKGIYFLRFERENKPSLTRKVINL
ncbi:MAG: T9SS type A sorting domain-containing protein [bacterium]|nr:T9SS type A sorting domain-containing protein [bacterium]